MKYKITTTRLIAAASVLSLVLFLYFYMNCITKPTIRIHDDQVEMQKFANAITKYIIEKGYNYKVELVESTLKEVRTQLLTGDLDITLELWKENNLTWFNKGVEANTIVDLGVLYSNYQQFWIVSKWYANEHNIQSVFDMKEHWQDFQDPQDPSKGIFFTCIYGWTCRDINKVKLSAYGLDRHFNTVSPHSPESLKHIYEKANEKRLPIFGYYWEPNFIMDRQDWHILEEPQYNEKTWLKVIERSLNHDGPQLTEACAYKTSGASKIASTTFSTTFPDIIEILNP